MEDKMVQEPIQTKGKLTYDDKVIKKIAGIAADSVQGVLTVSSGLIGSLTDNLRRDDETRGITVEVGEKQVALDMNTICEYGRHVPQLYDEMIKKVAAAVLEMTGLEVVELNMHVEDVLDKEAFEQMRQKLSSDDTDANSAGKGAAIPAGQAQSAGVPTAH